MNSDEQAAMLEEVAQLMRERPGYGFREFDVCDYRDQWQKARNWSQVLWWIAESSYGRTDRVRRRPRTIIIASREVPEPLREPPAPGQVVWIPALSAEDLVHAYQWQGNGLCLMFLERRLLHHESDGARRHAQALIKASGGGVGDE